MVKPHFKYNPELIAAGLKTTATIPERLKAFRSAGLHYSTVADAAGVSESAIRHWIGTDLVKPRPAAERVIDNIRCAFVIMGNDGLPYYRAAMALRSLDDQPPFHRPLEIIAEQPEVVFEIASHAVAAWNTLCEA